MAMQGTDDFALGPSSYVEEPSNPRTRRCLLRLLRLTKLLRIVRSSRLINRYRADMSISYGIIQLNMFVVVTRAWYLR